MSAPASPDPIARRRRAHDGSDLAHRAGAEDLVRAVHLGQTDVREPAAGDRRGDGRDPARVASLFVRVAFAATWLMITPKTSVATSHCPNHRLDDLSLAARSPVARAHRLPLP